MGARSGRRFRGTVAIAAALLIGACAPALAQATTYYAKGGGSGSASCLAGDPCSLPHAVSLAGGGDSIVLESGSEFKPGKTVVIEHAIDIGGTPGAPRPTINGPKGEDTIVLTHPGAVLHDVRVLGRESFETLDLLEGTVERVFAESEANSKEAFSAGCYISSGTVRDSICLSREWSGIYAAGSGGSHKVTLRNVDSIGGYDGILLYSPNAGSTDLVEATNTIASGGTKDLVANSGGGGAEILMTHSDYDTVETFSGATITAPGTNGNLTAPPQFVNAAARDFHQLATSPTVDAGLTEPANGALDLDGNARALAAHPVCGSTAGPTDIGAYELVPAPVPPCPPAPPTAAKPAPPGTKLKKAKIDADAGTAEFTFGGTGTEATGFACELIRPHHRHHSKGAGKSARPKPPKFSACRSPRTYKHLVAGKYTFEVEAKGPGGTDPTPAKRTFHIG